MAELDALLAAAEDEIAADVAAVLDDVAAEFTRALDDATEIVAARFSVSRIAGMWARRVPPLVRRLLGVAETAAAMAADDVDAELPDGWDDLPGRYEDGNLPPSLGDYVDGTEHLLRVVGDHLADAAVTALGAGLDAGEDIDQLRARLRNVFAREGVQLGEPREERIARTEATRAWNMATLAAARDMTGPGRPLVKQWQTRRDMRVRDAHDKVDGQLRLIDEPFNVAGIEMAAPGDPSAPAALTVNCRCILRLQTAERAAAFGTKTPRRGGVYETKDHPMPVTAAADGSHYEGAMIALVPADDDAQRLALDGGEEVEQLHLTLYYLGEGADWSPEHRTELIRLVQEATADLPGPVHARAFGVNLWNPGSDSSAWVYAVGDDRDRPDDAPTLADLHEAATDALEDRHGPEMPAQYTPWAPHVCAVYTTDTTPLDAMAQRLGPIRFDRIRLAFAGEHTDIPLGPEREAPMPDTDVTADAAATRPWSTPDDTALAFEDEETGDGRIFAPGALYWEGPGPWPLQYADEMLSGHQGAELAGAIESLGRDGGRIPGTGVLYTTRTAGADAVDLLEQNAPLGVSVDLDDVDLEFIDRTLDQDDVVLVASLASARVLHMEDGAYMINGETSGAWTASGHAMVRAGQHVQLVTAPGARVPADTVGELTAAGVLTAAAGDADDPDAGVVVHAERSGDFLMRITRGRVRGATLVTMPAYSRARIVLDPVEDDQQEPEGTAAAVTAAAPSSDHQQVVGYVRSAPIPVGAAEISKALGIPTESVRGHLHRAAQAGRIVRLAPGLYVGASTLPEGPEVTAAADGDDPALRELVASAWTAMQDLPPMPAAWFKEPTAEELPPGSGGVHYQSGRVYGWVAQRGEPHAGYTTQRLTIESLGDIDLSHFLRARFHLDDGTTIRAGAMTMNVGHHRDGAECETPSCQFDDTRTVGAIVTVGMNDRGLWFSGAAAPWLSEWDRRVFAGCQPSYHMKQGPGGRWQLRAVLTVPVPGHSSPLLASVAERSNLALAASAAIADTHPDGRPDGAGPDAPAPLVTPPGQPGPRPDTASGHPTSPAPAAPETVASLTTNPELLDGLLDAMERRREQRAAAMRAEVEQLTQQLANVRDEIAASAAPKEGN
ncbi:phage minor head protein [Streptomyces sp. DH12]|uniref:phage minor head protein n=1 Tax=Streptomyces sp. DH12 TaxID=2857010 RepID=UPI001E29D2F5|nr:phage minor head protein [Streptomyces sp. DH12]